MLYFVVLAGYLQSVLQIIDSYELNQSRVRLRHVAFSVYIWGLKWDWLLLSVFKCVSVFDVKNQCLSNKKIMSRNKSLVDFSGKCIEQWHYRDISVCLQYLLNQRCEFRTELSVYTEEFSYYFTISFVNVSSTEHHQPLHHYNFLKIHFVGFY